MYTVVYDRLDNAQILITTITLKKLGGKCTVQCQYRNMTIVSYFGLKINKAIHENFYLHVSRGKKDNLQAQFNKILIKVLQLHADWTFRKHLLNSMD